jgi:hypothetical protein
MLNQVRVYLTFVPPCELKEQTMQGAKPVSRLGCIRTVLRA